MTYTHKFGPWELVKSFAINDNRGDALRLERYIKKQKSRKVILKPIEDPQYFHTLAQLVGVPTCRD